MMRISFSVPGEPVGKQRVNPRGNNGAIFKPKQTRLYEKRILQEFQLAHPRCATHLGPVMIRFTAIFAIPQTWPKAAKAAATAGLMYHTSKPDKENIEKALWDALSPVRKGGVVITTEGHPWRDDSQCMGGGIKRYGTNPRLDVTIDFIDQPSGIMTPAQARHENEAVTAEQRAKGFLTGRTSNQRNAKKPKAPTSAETPLQRAIAAADARDATARRKSPE